MKNATSQNIMLFIGFIYFHFPFLYHLKPFVGLILLEFTQLYYIERTRSKLNSYFCF